MLLHGLALIDLKSWFVQRASIRMGRGQYKVRESGGGRERETERKKENGCIDVYVYIYIYIHVCVCVHMCT